MWMVFVVARMVVVTVVVTVVVGCVVIVVGGSVVVDVAAALVAAVKSSTKLSTCDHADMSVTEAYSTSHPTNSPPISSKTTAKIAIFFIL